MKTKTSGVGRGGKCAENHNRRDGSHWMLIAGGALLSSLSIRLGYKLKQAIDAKQKSSFNPDSNPNPIPDPAHATNSAACQIRPNIYSFTEDDFTSLSGAGESDGALPLVALGQTNHHSSSSDSPCVSESGYDVFSKRQALQKLRQQLKRRDDMILEMQDQIAELQSSVSAQLARSAHLESQLEATNRELFDSEREIQRLRKAIADHCVGYSKSNGHDEGTEMLRRQVRELKEVIEGKDYLLSTYKDQKTELSLKVNDLQHRLDSQVPNIL